MDPDCQTPRASLQRQLQMDSTPSSRVSELQFAKRQLEFEIRNLKITLAAKDSDIVSLKLRIKNISNDEVAVIQANLDRLQVLYDEAVEREKTFMDECHTYSSNFQAVAEVNNALNAQLADLSEQVQRLETENRLLKAQQVEVEGGNRVNELQAKVTVLEGELLRQLGEQRLYNKEVEIQQNVDKNFEIQLHDKILLLEEKTWDQAQKIQELMVSNEKLVLEAAAALEAVPEAPAAIAAPATATVTGPKKKRKHSLHKDMLSQLSDSAAGPGPSRLCRINLDHNIEDSSNVLDMDLTPIAVNTSATTSPMSSTRISRPPFTFKKPLPKPRLSNIGNEDLSIVFITPPEQFQTPMNVRQPVGPAFRTPVQLIQRMRLITPGPVPDREPIEIQEPVFDMDDIDSREANEFLSETRLQRTTNLDESTLIRPHFLAATDSGFVLLQFVALLPERPRRHFVAKIRGQKKADTGRLHPVYIVDLYLKNRQRKPMTFIYEHKDDKKGFEVDDHNVAANLPYPETDHRGRFTFDFDFGDYLMG